MTEEEVGVTRLTVSENTLRLDASHLATFNAWLAESCAVGDAGRDEVLHTASTDFGSGWEADIKIVNSEDGPYVDAVLFHNGSEVMCLEPEFEQFDGQYIFDVAPSIPGMARLRFTLNIAADAAKEE